MDFLPLVLLTIAIMYTLHMIVKKVTALHKAETTAKQEQIGEITLETLQFYNGLMMERSILVAIQGDIYDVTKDYEKFGVGKALHVYAGKEIAYALAKGSLDEDDCTGDVGKLTKEQEDRLEALKKQYAEAYPLVGKVVEPKMMTLKELAQYDGTDPSKPILLAIKGDIFDVTKGRAFYGPDGMYPFAGKECARAFALYSVETSDCTDDLEGLSYTELENLKEWQGKFYWKYPVVGKVKGKKSAAKR